MESSVSDVLIACSGEAEGLLARTQALAVSIRPRAELSLRIPIPREVAEAEVLAGRLLSSGQLLPPAVANAARVAGTYRMGSVPARLAVFRWTRGYAVAHALEVLQWCLSGKHLAPALLQARSVLELVGGFALLMKDLDGLPPADLARDKDLELREWMNAVDDILGKRSKGTRLDWGDISEKGLLVGKKKSIKVEEGFADRTATDLLGGVDLLDKSVKGARKTYEYLSEYAHPNVAFSMLGLDSITRNTLKSGLTLSQRIYIPSSVGKAAIRDSSSTIIEALKVVLASCDHQIALDARLAEFQAGVSRAAQKAVRRSVRDRRDLFQSNEPCPCHSGKIVAACCGR